MLKHTIRFALLVSAHVALATAGAVFIAAVKLARAGESYGR